MTGRRVLVLLLLCSFAVLLPAIETKRPLNGDQELKLRETDAAITVSGETFSYAFSKGNGLIGSVVVLGREISVGPIPDLVLAEHFNQDFSTYAARRETSARVRTVTAAPERVVIEAEGAYAGEAGNKFPLTYRISYDISIDGVVLVAVTNTATADCSFRWLTLSGGAVRPEYAKFLNWMPDQSTAQTTRYLFQPVADKEDKLLAGVWLPWIWIGDQNRGLEVTTWNVGSQTYNQLDSTSRRDQNEMFIVRREPAGVRWENFLVRRTLVYARKGWQRGGEFVLAVTPSKRFEPYHALFKGAHLGPHQHVASLTLPDEERIRTLARNGYDLMVGMANWRSGEYVPLNDADLRRTIDLCHKYGMKIIPYVTLVDLSHATETHRLHGEEWAIEPTTEYAKAGAAGFRDPAIEAAYRNDPEMETTLMCPGAPGWREHWKKTIDRALSDYDFDGLYIDFWYGRMACENVRHGCGGRFRKHTVLGSRDMLTYAYNRVKAKKPDGIIKANTNTLATALVTSLVDIRLVGESIDITKLDPHSRQWLYSSYRLGEPTEFLWARSQWNREQRLAFAALINFLPKYYERPPFEPRVGFDDFDVYRFLEAAKGDWRLGISGDGHLAVKPAEVAANTVKLGENVLATLINTGESAITGEVEVRPKWMAYEPLSERLLETGSGILKVELGPGAYRHVLMTESPGKPRLLFALGARARASENWDAGRRRLRFSVDGVEGARIRFAVYCELPVKSVRNARGESVAFEGNSAGRLVRFEASHEPGAGFELQF
ncbi:MAG: hypothetical protein KIT09_00630 [Bryobacteraceae bacterium]|nr:hypothetical protein [Bryobacteraceae bacterium]